MSLSLRREPDYVRDGLYGHSSLEKSITNSWIANLDGDGSQRCCKPQEPAAGGSFIGAGLCMSWHPERIIFHPHKAPSA